MAAEESDDISSRALERTRQAVIDIGSNSVRLVIYDGPQRAPFQICNEKALCGLGREIGEDGSLNPKAVESALSILTRFRCLLTEYGDPPTDIVATAAVREAKDGEAFVAAVRALGLPVDIIPGGEEANLSAFGVASFEPGASGLVGDMGGGSLELVSMREGEPRDAVSLSIGPLRLMRATNGDYKAAAKIVEAAFNDVDWLKSEKNATLFAVGGAWRAIARVHMQLRNHPLPVLHHYEMNGKDVIDTCELISKQSRSSLEATPGISSKRADAIPYAAVVLRMLISDLKIQTVSISAGGLREGLLYRRLTPELRRFDPLIAGATFFASRMSPEEGMGGSYRDLLDGAFANETPAQKRIRNATCLLGDIGAFFHPDMRADQAFDTALRAPFYGVTHPERAAIALSLFCRHAGAKTPAGGSAVINLMSEDEKKRATQIGLGLRFGAAIAPKAPHAMRQCSFSVKNDELQFRAPEALRALIDETARKRLDAFAASTGLKPSIDFQS
ncbi:MAG: Ppx/GppA family phosphatase [Parvularculaceae bacterium]|nr:Ppx/GppA family phosphatase [Parvularculaceae bacterium]